jgi:hypothetical protein
VHWRIGIARPADRCDLFRLGNKTALSIRLPTIARVWEPPQEPGAPRRALPLSRHDSHTHGRERLALCVSRPSHRARPAARLALLLRRSGRDLERSRETAPPGATRQRSHAAESAELDYSFRAAGVGGRTRFLPRIRVPGLPSLTGKTFTIHVASAGRSGATDRTREHPGRASPGPSGGHGRMLSWESARHHPVRGRTARLCCRPDPSVRSLGSARLLLS